jgi:hypothetical protein
MRFYDPSKRRIVHVTCYDDHSDVLPIFKAEIVDSRGEVVEYIERIYGHTALTALVASRGWEQMRGLGDRRL